MAGQAHVYELKVRSTYLTEQQIETTHHFGHSAAAQEEGIMDAWESGCKTNYLALGHDDYRLESLSIREIVQFSSAQHAEVVRAIGEDWNDGTVGATCAPFLAVRATLYTALAGRSFRGANSFAGANDDDFEGSQLILSDGRWWDGVGDYLNDVTSTFDDGNGAGAWVVFSRKHWRANAAITACNEPITSFIVHTTLRTMRSRLTY